MVGNSLRPYPSIGSMNCVPVDAQSLTVDGHDARELHRQAVAAPCPLRLQRLRLEALPTIEPDREGLSCTVNV